MSSSDQGNIFLTWENLAFSLPLIIVVSSYWIFTYVPWWATASVGAIGFLIFKIHQQLKEQHAKKLQAMDESTMKKIVGDLLEEEDNSNENDANAGNKKGKKNKIDPKKDKVKVQQRLAQERKAAAKKGGKTAAVESDDEDEDLTKFAKSSKSKR